MGRVLRTRLPQLHRGKGMSQADLETIARRVLRKAMKEGSVHATDVQAELRRAGFTDEMSEAVLALISHSLTLRGERYHYVSPEPTRQRMRIKARQDQNQLKAIHDRVTDLVQQYQAQAECERRAHTRTPYVQPVRIELENGPSCHMISLDISLAGIRVVGTTDLAGKKGCIWIPRPELDHRSYPFMIQFLWSKPVGDGVLEAGGMFLEALTDTTPSDPAIS